MPYQFVKEAISQGRYEPEGIYLDFPLSERAEFVQGWGSNPEFYSGFLYNGIPLKGYLGLGFDVQPNTGVLAVDRGRVCEINMEPGGFDRYIKIEHRWGESLYARLQRIEVETGQLVQRGMPVAVIGRGAGEFGQRFHFGIRIRPFSRFDGWGGFSNPLPYLNLESALEQHIEPLETDEPLAPPLPLAVETDRMHRP